MNEQTWMNDQLDRSEWEPGPWTGEPDKVQWTDDATGLVCLAVRQTRNGHWCGYVGVAPGHKLHGKDYDAAKVLSCSEDCHDDGEWPNHYACSPQGALSAHGGLTFADECQEADAPCRGVCHVAAPGEPDKLWWLGFDCAHCDDLAPRDTAPSERRWRNSFPGKVYRTLEYVKGECTELARQIAAL